MPLDLATLISSIGESPLLLMLVLFAATFVAEDLATVAAGVYVAQSGAPACPAVLSVVLGTAAGDIALYMTGRWGAHTRLGKRLRARPDVRHAENWVRERALPLVFAARFLPGMRLPVFTASGFVRAQARPVIAIIGLTTPVWTIALFEVARAAGSSGAERLLTAIVPLGLVLVLASAAIRRRAFATTDGRA